ncbi:MAG: PLP-dependent cysteine synthase family protein [Pyrinomonadaceae bacterium]
MHKQEVSDDDGKPETRIRFFMEAAVLETEWNLAARADVTLKNSLEASIGNTPLIRLRSVVRSIAEGSEIYAKAEHLNPGGSVKDRAAFAMISSAERSGKLTPDKIILDATSGNTGIALAMISAARGYRLTLTLPKNASEARKRTLRYYGAKIIETDPMDGTDGAQVAARELAEKDPDKYVYLDQYNNPANWRAHFETTGREIWQQTNGLITHFVAGLGTTGTFTGTTRRLREFKPDLNAVSVQPDSPLHGLEGMKHLETAIVPGIYDAALADENVTVTTEDARAMTRRLAREEGLFVGPSSGANVAAAIKIAERVDSEATIVTILCDGGSKYIDDGFWIGG